MSALKILVIPGSLRTGSHNAKLAAAAAYEFAQAGVDVSRISLGDFPLPVYDGDLQNKSGVPKHCVQGSALNAASATVIANQLALSFADQAYDDTDRLKHPADIEALKALVRQLIDVAQHMM